MKRFMILIGLILISTNAYAEYTHDNSLLYWKKPRPIINNYYSTTNVTNNYLDEKNEFGLKLDAPNLIEVYKNWYVGVEGGKDLYSTNMSEGWNAYGKVTYTGTLFSFIKKEVK